MQPDLVQRYKRAALQAADPLTYGVPKDVDDGPEERAQSGISQADIITKAFGLYTAKYPKRAKIAVNPQPPVKFKPRWNSITGVDRMDESVPASFKRVSKPKGYKNVDESEDSEPQTRGTKRKAVDDLVVVVDKVPVESHPEAPASKMPRVDSEKENNLIVRHKNELEIIPYRPAESARRPPPTTMNVARKRTVKEIDVQIAEPAKRMKYGAPQDATKTSHELATKDRAVQHENRVLSAQQVFNTKALEADNDSEHTKQSDPVDSKPHVKQNRQQSPTDSFSDGSAWFEELLSQQVDGKQEDDGTGDMLLDDLSGDLLPSTPATSVSVPPPPKATPQASLAIRTSTIESTPTPSSLASPPDIRPSLRDKPMQILDQRSDIAGSQSGQRIVTCFRIAEALRLRTSTILAPKPLSSFESSPVLPVELYARIHLTYRDSETQVFVFEDVFFPNKMPFLRAIHRSRQQCERDVPALLRRNTQQSTEGGFLCRVVVEFDTNLPENPSNPLQAEVTDLRVAEWSEIKRVRGVVEPTYQDE